jgi:hypothetical protein
MMTKQLTTFLFILISLGFLSERAWCIDYKNTPFLNKLEGKSVHFYRKTFFGRWNFNRRIEKFSKELDDKKLEFIKKTFIKNDYICEEKLLTKLNKLMEITDRQYIRRTYYLYIIRINNLIDDVALGNYLNFNKVFPSVNLSSFNPKRFTQKNEKPLRIFSLRSKSKQCFIENTTSFFGEFKFNKKRIKTFLKNSSLKKFEKKLLLRAFKKDLYKFQLSNKKYEEKLRTIRSKISPDNTGTAIDWQKSNIISRPVDELKTSPRVNLLKKYNAFQIAIMNKVIKNFQQRAEMASWLNIQIFDTNNNLFEEIKIESPTEVYRFCIKLFRKEMSEIKINQLFNNTVPSFHDFLAASYEMGTINHDFLEELYKIEDLWNPKRTKWEKVKVWASITSQIASVFTPPPYNYLISFGLIAIEYYNRKTETASYEHSIFGDIK